MPEERNSWKVAVLAMLCMLTATMMSLASSNICKYVAKDTVKASGKVASWNIALTSPVPTTNPIVKMTRTTSSYGPYTVKITNNSEVHMTPGLSVEYGTSYGDMAWNGTTTYRAQVVLARAAGETNPVAPGGVATYSMTVQMPPTLVAACYDGYVTAYLKCTADQVD